MRGSSAMKLLAACCGGLLMSVPVNAKEIFDKRTGEDKGSKKDCVTDGYRYIQVEVFDFNLNPWIKAAYTQVAGECGEKDFTPYSESFEYKGDRGGGNKLQMDMYICAPFGEYELEIEVKSTNGDGKPLAKVAWEIEYGPNEYHIWDTLNTPLINTRNGATMADVPYAPIPPEYSGSGPGTVYKWPLPDSVGYYSTLDTLNTPLFNTRNGATMADVPYAPIPPKYSGSGPGTIYKWPLPKSESYYSTLYTGPTGKYGDEAETERMFDGLGIDDDGLKENGVMTIEKCAVICNKGSYSYMGLQSAVQCVCGNAIEGDNVPDCGLEDDLDIPEYKYLCSGDSQVLCGTNNMVSIYSLGGGGTGPAPTPPAPTPPAPTPPAPTPPAPTPSGGDGYESLGCIVDNKNNRVMKGLGPIKKDTMSAEICFDICMEDNEGYTHFGTEYGHEICFDICMEDNEGYTHFGTEYGHECFCTTAVADNLDLEYGGCVMPCEDPDVDGTGVEDSDREKCGGENAISIYKIGGGGTVPAPTPSGGDGYGSLGCFTDAQPGPSGKKVRIMDNKTSLGDMTAEVCFGLCNDGTNTHFGTQYGEECWCVYDPDVERINQFNDVDLPCNYQCTGDATETCGGWNAMTVYEIN
eukprot:g18613.t1